MALTTKRCSQCKRRKPLTAFNRMTRSPDGRQSHCRECRAEYQRANPNRQVYVRRWGAKNPAARARHRRASLERLRAAVYAAYGARCACCGETRREFLTFDHVEGRDEEHARLRTYSVMVRAKREGFPPTYRILCWNCNCARGIHGYCPHEREVEEAA